MTYPKGYVLALDASTTAVGWCIACGDRYRCSGTFKPGGDDAKARIVEIHMWLCRQLAEIAPCAVAYEEPHGNHGNRRTDRLLGAVMGVVMAAAAQFRCQFVAVHNAKVRATGYHKLAIRDAAYLVGKKPGDVNGDEADAIGVWQAVLVMMREEAGS